jgi:L-2-hydroxyglutarate oxidase LhgO
VLHSGIYYAPGSLKARLCVQGQRELYAYCEQRGIPTERCGKVIVATNESESARLENLSDGKTSAALRPHVRRRGGVHPAQAATGSDR